MLIRELGIGIVAYSPLGNGFLSLGPKIVDSFSNDDCRKVRMPGFLSTQTHHALPSAPSIMSFSKVQI